ncbi:MAG: 30S ribosomal protein S10 [Candidatus Aenigmarchaeota archaeon]|nr:30S ribosomal protein S10 [Candidatus Aenigmarchaeota archaeon]RLI96558.1 MAG: 30S ribosomal protein S10 [Candidatus Aenigmarchaeota archaeon]
MQKARIKLTGRDPKQLDDICSEIKDTAEKLGVAVSGPIPLPTKRIRIPVMKTPCGDGMHRGGGGKNWEKWEMRIHKRVLDIGANERVLRQITRIPIPRDVNIEIELTD